MRVLWRTFLIVLGPTAIDDRVEALSLHSDGRIVKHEGFLWPPLEELSFDVRVHVDGATRDVDEIPLEEIIERLESGDPSREEGERLFEEGRQTLDEIREILDRGEGEVVELPE